MDNKAFAVRTWYRPTAERLLAEAARCGTVRLILDGSKVGAAHQLLMVALAFRKRALPIAWDWVKGPRGYSKTTTKGRYSCISHTSMDWQLFSSRVTARDQIAWYAHAIVTYKHLYQTHLLAYWESGAKEPWLLMTNLPEASLALKAYRRRMWIEVIFGDWKRHGVCLEQTHLRGSVHLSRRTFLAAVLHLWLVAFGVRAIRAAKRPLVDRKDRRDLSMFRIGLYLIDRFTAQDRYPAIRLIPYFETVR